jgi:malonate-semialdehyde dehydrogenase (acetylating) / methylmalonate-semialdehyde dehydrogenase
MSTIEKLNNYIDPFSGWKNSFFGTLHAQGKHAVEFFTQTKVVVERWLGEWSRKF